MNCWHMQQFGWISKICWVKKKKPTSTVIYIYIYVTVLQNDSDGRWQAGEVEAVAIRGRADGASLWRWNNSISWLQWWPHKSIHVITFHNIYTNKMQVKTGGIQFIINSVVSIFLIMCLCWCYHYTVWPVCLNSLCCFYNFLY